MYFLFLSVTEQKENGFKCDPLTQNVAEQSSNLLRFFGEDVTTAQDPSELCVKIMVEGYYMLGVIEGCNAASIIILFIAFVIAFKGTLKKTILFCLFGVVTIYLVNVLRISILTYGVSYFRAYTKLLHNIIFPAIIYGYIFLLWIVWVNYFSNLKKSS